MVNSIKSLFLCRTDSFEILTSTVHVHVKKCRRSWKRLCFCGLQQILLKWPSMRSFHEPPTSCVYVYTHTRTQPDITRLNTQHQHDSGLPGNHMGFSRLCVCQALFRPCLFSPPTLHKLTNTSPSALFDTLTKNFGWIT